MKVQDFESFSLNEDAQGGGNKFILVRFGNAPNIAVSKYFSEIAIKNPKPSLMKGPDSFVTMFETALTKEALVAGFDRLGIKYNLYQVVHTSAGGPVASIVAREPSKEQLLAKLEKAVRDEDYEEATRLRDKIAALEGTPAAPVATPAAPATAGNPSESQLHSFDDFLLESEFFETVSEELTLIFSTILERAEVFTGDKKRDKKDKDKRDSKEETNEEKGVYETPAAAKALIKEFDKPTEMKAPAKRDLTKQETKAMLRNFSLYSWSKVGADGKIVLGGGTGKLGKSYITEEDLKTLVAPGLKNR